MPIIKSAKKALRQNRRKRVINLRRIKKMKSIIKETEKLVKEKNKKEASDVLSKAYKAIDKATKKGILKKNTASRKKSHLAKIVGKI